MKKMAYMIYQKNNIRTGSQSTHGRFEQFDRKKYSSQQAAMKKLAVYKKQFKSIDNKYGVKYVIRKVSSPRKSKSLFGGFY